MEENIFEGAKFGDKFLTRDDRVAIYHRFETKLNLHVLFVENLDCCLYCENTGLHAGNHIVLPEWKEDIISRYHEPIDFDKLHELANKLCPLEGFSNAEEGFIDEREDIEDSWVDGFKSGYRKAKEE